MFFAFENVLKYLFYSAFLNINQNLAKKGANKTITLHILQNTGYKKNVLLQLPFWPKVGVFQLVFFETKNIDVEQKT